MIIAIVGPTASGKTSLSLELAQALGGSDQVEVINADAMQLYKGMDIGTAKLAVAERRGITHHQLDVLEVTQEASVAAYQRHARDDLTGIIKRGKTAVVVGGSGLYVRALLDQLEFPGTDPQIRAHWEEALQVVGPETLWELLKTRDPVAAERIAPENGRRLVRALEVVDIQGSFSASLPRQEYVFPSVYQFGLRPDLALLDTRITERAEKMFEQGLVEETRQLLGQGILSGKTAPLAIGYAQAIAVIQGCLPVNDACEQISQATKALARRQIKWFKRDERITWLDPTDLRTALIQLVAQLDRA